MTHPKMIQMAFLTLAVFLMTGCNQGNTTPPKEASQEPAQVQTTSQEAPSGEEITDDEVVAMVNGAEIVGADVKMAQQAYMIQGQQVSQDQAIEEAINQELLSQEATEGDFMPTTEAAEAMIEEQLAQQGGNLDQYKEQIATQGGSYQEQLADIKINLAIQNYLDAQLESMTFEVTDEEVTTFYDQYKAQSSQEIPPLEAVKDQLILTLKQQKKQEEVGSIIQDLRSQADIEMNL